MFIPNYYVYDYVRNTLLRYHIESLFDDNIINRSLITQYILFLFIFTSDKKINITKLK